MMYYFNYFLKLFVFWLIYFLVYRIFFIIIYFDDFSKCYYIEVITIFLKSFRLDASFIAYLSTLIILLLYVNIFFRSKKYNNFFSSSILWLNSILIFITALIFGGEISLYSEWGSKLNFKALSHLFNPLEVFLTATLGHYLIIFFSIVIGSFFIKMYVVFVHQYFYSKKYNFKQALGALFKLPFVLAFFLLIIRGGLQEIPINTSDAYFSKNMIVNDVTVNPNWNLVQSVLKSKRNFEGNPYEKYSQEDIDIFLKELEIDNDSTLFVLNNKKPNIIFILLESWSADNIESLDGLKGITPSFKYLQQEGLLFNNFYSNGWTSDQAMTSIFSSFPVFPYVAVINQTDKARNLPSLNKSLSQEGYHTSYFFGGQLTYGNIKGFLISQGFDVVKDEKDYNNLPKGRLGVHDEYMFNQFKKELNILPQPFMSTLLTISSHSPFDFPAKHNLSFNSKEDKYVNSVAYSDKCLGDFILSVKNETWYKNTLFIIVADHSHNSPIKRRLAEKERFKIPMLWYGDAIKDKYKGKEWNKLGSHIDISPTILSQLGFENKSYKFGFDIFNFQNNTFVPYAFPKGYGLITEKGNYAFSEGYNKVLELYYDNNMTEESIKKQTEIYFQLAFESYLNY